MTEALRRAGRPTVALALFLLILISAGPALAPSASAHDVLVSSDPEADASVEHAPEAVTLTFSDEVLDTSPMIRVTAADGTVLTEGAPAIDGSVVSLPLPDAVPAGEYTVQWRIVSADGHPVEDSLTFTVTVGTEAAASSDDSTGSEGASDTSVQQTAAPVTTPDAQSDESSAPTGANRVWLIVVGLVVLGSLVAVLVAALRRNKR